MPRTVRTTLRYEGDPVKGSRFIVDIAPVATESIARDLLAQAAADFADASHHCSAWRIATPAIDRASDDGEPSGSGRPILAQLAGRDLVNTAVIVTRFFGGTKLGVGGLMRAYGGAAGEALDTMTLRPWIAETIVTFTHDLAYTDGVERMVRQLGGSIVERNFTAVVDVQARIPTDALAPLTQQLADLSAGTILLDE